MCNLYTLTETVEEMRRVFGPFVGDRDKLPPFGEIYPGRAAPVLRRDAGGELQLETMSWGFPGPAAAKGRPVTNVRNLDSPFWRSALNNRERRCIVPVTRFCEWTAEPDPDQAQIENMVRASSNGRSIVRVRRDLAAGRGGSSHGVSYLRRQCGGRGGASQSDAGHTASITCHERELACALAVPFPDTDMRRMEAAG